MLLLPLPSLDPFENLAVEDLLLRRGPPREGLLLAWRTAPTVVLGRFQNPWAEARVPLLAEEGVLLARRRSGGGCVYCDPGNVNLSFLTPGTRLPRRRNTALVRALLRGLGLAPLVNDRLDVLLPAPGAAGPGGGPPRKVSGSAFRRTRDAGLHHCSLLVDSDTGRLRRCLSPSLPGARGPAVQSRRSPVATLREAGADVGAEGLLARLPELLRGEGVREPRPGEARLPGPEEAARAAEGLADWGWTVGETPRFSFRDAASGLALESRGGLALSLEAGGRAVAPEPPAPMDSDRLLALLGGEGGAPAGAGALLARTVGPTLALNSGRPGAPSGDTLPKAPRPW